MKRTTQLTTYSLPAEVEKRYWTLVQTKMSFFKRISTAEQRKLEALYELLTDAWNRNHTSILLQDYEAQMLKLENLSNEIKGDCFLYRVAIEQELKKRITEMKARLMQIFDWRKRTLPIWKEDTWARLKKLAETKELVTQSSDQAKAKAWKEQMELSIIEEENLSKKREELKLKSEQLKQLQIENQNKLNSACKQLALMKQPFQASLQDLKNKNETNLSLLMQGLLKSSKQIKQEETDYKERLKQMRQQLNSNMKDYERQLLNELRDAIKVEIPNFPQLLEDYWVQEDWSKIGIFIRNMQTEQGQLEQRLKTSLTRIGISFENYIDAFGRNLSAQTH